MLYLAEFKKRDKTPNELTTVHVIPVYVFEAPDDQVAREISVEFARHQTDKEKRAWKLESLGRIELLPILGSPEPMDLTYSIQKEEFKGYIFFPMIN